MAQINIAGTLHNTEEIQGDALNSHVVVHADEILDSTQEKKQSEVNADVDTALADRYTKEETYSKSQVDNLITTPAVQYVTVATYSALPATGEADTIYRVASWDGSAVDAGKYSEYAWNGSAYQLLAVRSSVGEVFDISEYHASGGTFATYADLAAALGTGGANVPEGLRKGGMSIKFVLTSDNKYVQYFLTKDEWSASEADWEKMNLDQEVTLMGRDVSQLLVDVYDTEQDALVGVDTDKKVINSSGVVATASATNYHVVTFDISALQGKSVYVTANTNWGNCLYAIYDGNNNLLSKSSIAPSSGSKYGINDEEIALSSNAVTLYVAYNVSWEQAAVKYTKNVSKIEELEDIVDLIPTEDKYVEGVDNVISGKFISSNGVINNAGETYTISNNVVVSPGQLILITASSNWGNALYAFYASDDTVVQVGQLAASTGTVTELNDSPVTVPANAAYIVVARNLDSQNPLSVKWEDGKQLKKRFSGKKWVVVGDSLTEHNGRTLKNYHDYVAEYTDILVVNMGVSGSGYMRLSESNKAFYQRVASIPTDADVVTIFGSGNDLGVSPYDLGEPSDTGTSTICGCINTTLDNILNLFLAANKVPVIGVITPTPWANNEPSTTTGRMPAYCSAIIECCRRKSIPVLDLYHESNLHPDNATFRTLAYSRDEGNGVHPDERGHQIIAPMFQNFLQSLLLY